MDRFASITGPTSGSGSGRDFTRPNRARVEQMNVLPEVAEGLLSHVGATALEGAGLSSQQIGNRAKKRAYKRLRDLVKKGVDTVQGKVVFPKKKVRTSRPPKRKASIYKQGRSRKVPRLVRPSYLRPGYPRDRFIAYRPTRVRRRSRRRYKLYLN